MKKETNITEFKKNNSITKKIEIKGI